jgi:alcohol dehydrogenase (cytochrome c)
MRSPRIGIASVWLLIIAGVMIVQPALLAAQSAPDLRQPPGNEWPTVGGDWGNTRYSTLDQINASNVQNLKGAWATHTGSGIGSKYSFEATPLVQGGVMYVPTGNDDVLALDAKTGQQIWEYRSGIDQSINTVCCGWDNRGVALGEGKVFLGQLDGSFVALDQKTGEQVWKAQVGTWQEGYTITAAPLYYDGVVYTGISGAEFGVRGKLTALDAASGQELWHFWTVPAPGDFGGDTWPSPTDPDPVKQQAYLHGGATIWNTPTVDPDLGLIYFSTGNAGPDFNGSVRPGDNLFTSSILALDAKTGTYKWHYQEVHHDLWDFDAPSPTVLFDINLNGQQRHAVAEAGKTGFVYILDRTNGTPLVGIDEKAVPQEPRQATAATQPYPEGDPLIPQCPDPVPNFPIACIFGTYWDVPTVFAPLGNGGVNWANMSFDAQNGLLYATAGVRPSAIAAGYTAWQEGQRYTGAGASTVPIGAKYYGTYSAVDPRTNKLVWQKKTTYSLNQGSGTLSTAGGVLFHGEPDGNFQALDAKTGDVLWEWQTGAGADAPAMTYSIDGQQYVAIASGGVGTQTTSANGDMIWAFTLNGSPNDRLQPMPAPTPPATEAGFTAAPVATNKIQIVDYGYNPNRITIPAGTSVTFTNSGNETHTATAIDGSWDTGPLANGATATVEFDTPGTYTFNCTPHPFMIGQIVVTPTT